MAEDLDALVERGGAGAPDATPAPGAGPAAKGAAPRVERYELTGRQILVYISNLSHDQPISFSYRLRARFPLVAQTPASTAYDYYNPDVAGEAPPQKLEVRR